MKPSCLSIFYLSLSKMLETHTRRKIHVIINFTHSLLCENEKKTMNREERTTDIYVKRKPAADYTHVIVEEKNGNEKKCTSLEANRTRGRDKKKKKGFHSFLQL